MKFILSLTILILICSKIHSQDSVDNFKKYTYDIEGYNYDGGSFPIYAQGSGFFIRYNSKILFVTAKHVLGGYDDSCRRVKNAPYIMNIALHNEKGAINFQSIQINTEKFQDTVNCFGFRESPDLAFFTIENPENKTIYSIEHFLPFDIPKNFDSLQIIGFPTVEERDSVTGKHLLKPASLLLITRYSLFQNSRYHAMDGIKTDSINYVVETKDIVINRKLKGYSGSPVFIKDKTLNRYFFSGIFIAAEEVHPYIFIINPKTIEENLKNL